MGGGVYIYLLEGNVAKHCGNGTYTGKSRVVQRKNQRGSIVNALKKEKKEKSIFTMDLKKKTLFDLQQQHQSF